MLYVAICIGLVLKWSLKIKVLTPSPIKCITRYLHKRNTISKWPLLGIGKLLVTRLHSRFTIVIMPHWAHYLRFICHDLISDNTKTDCSVTSSVDHYITRDYLIYECEMAIECSICVCRHSHQTDLMSSTYKEQIRNFRVGNQFTLNSSVFR